MSANAFGTLVTDGGTPIICMHGGSDWLCEGCARELEGRKGVRRATQDEQKAAWSGGGLVTRCTMEPEFRTRDGEVVPGKASGTSGMAMMRSREISARYGIPQSHDLTPEEQRNFVPPKLDCDKLGEK